ncbi:hypothetical protein G7K_2578-t1 [Saitoella complicata NRRL Y-17804]|uniref:Uncharacterized protein n=1 Tax=Saitoella complicata (strain BCRC 22490 / CBS 7301 / JCM 7358 / NBRC 10748 / NRRL Y-17804) TaxID=698492 RepID=A0A0E9NG86_SAICN|nr:hypothetical protein G7K_2578-t1 [Saitoella complicata NRRL Y-17804]
MRRDGECQYITSIANSTDRGAIINVNKMILMYRTHFLFCKVGQCLSVLGLQFLDQGDVLLLGVLLGST